MTTPSRADVVLADGGERSEAQPPDSTASAIFGLTLLAVLLLSAAGLSFLEAVHGPLERMGGEWLIWRIGLVLGLLLTLKIVALVQRTRYRAVHKTAQAFRPSVWFLNVAGFVLLFVGLGTHLYGYSVLYQGPPGFMDNETVRLELATAAAPWELVAGSLLVVGTGVLTAGVYGSLRRVQTDANAPGLIEPRKVN